LDRSAVFVDAGFLLAAGGRLICGTTSRAAFACDYAGLTEKLAGWVDSHSGLNCLRTYWYDGAINGVPSRDHERIGGLPYVKVRLGRLIRGEQKGVDALIYRDLMTLARERAITQAYLLSGDEDLREGVVAAQDMGVQVVLLGIPTGQRTNQSAALVREADEHVILPREHWEPHFSSASATPASTTPSPTPSAAQTAGRSFAKGWTEKASADDAAALLDDRPKIPRELDVQLLVDAEQSVGSLRDRQDLKRELRAAFWDEIEGVVRSQAPADNDGIEGASSKEAPISAQDENSK
jgi:uncharacterized LabA/DUF88 family protein